MKYVFLLLFPSKAFGAAAVMEGIAATKATIFVDTGNARVDMANKSYSGGTSNVALHVSSNVSINNDNCVIYSTGGITCLGVAFGSGNQWTTNGNHAYYNGTGNIGIGTSITSPIAPLNLGSTSGSASVENRLMMFGEPGFSTTYGILVTDNSGDGILKWWALTNGSTATTPSLAISRVNGNVGIGSTNPGSLLDVVQTVGTAEVFRVHAPNAAGTISELISDGGVQVSWGLQANYQALNGLTIGPSTTASGHTYTDTVLNLIAGKVGIETTNPGDILEIDGTTASGGVAFQIKDTKTGGSSHRIGYLSATNNFEIYDNKNSAYILRSDSSGVLTFPNLNMHNIAISTDLAGTNVGDTAFSRCFTSTKTITFTGSPSYLVVRTHGTVNPTGSNIDVGMGVLDNGVPATGLGSGATGKGFWGQAVDTNGDGKNAEAAYYWQPASGSHNICLMGRVSSNSFLAGGKSGTACNSVFIWEVEEVK